MPNQVVNLSPMHEMNAPESTDRAADDDQVEDGPAPAEAVEPASEDDSVLDGFEKDLEDVAQALDALDANDLDAAEALTVGLDTLDEPAATED
jgi:hypothetical protein